LAKRGEGRFSEEYVSFSIMDSLLNRKHALNSVVFSQKQLDTLLPCTYNSTNYRINLKNNVMGKMKGIKRYGY
jgi:metal-dependent HD superfamily phosphatase/phosphodiesterase